ncbi:MAG TPA: TonB-dependent receptor [Lacunisphaera sp.]|nr:TonB-dependent receptor [Lacunisphaera sp.]
MWPILFVSTSLEAQTVTLPRLVVTATRLAEEAEQVPFTLTVLPGDQLRLAPTATLDGALRSVPGFSLFRRSDSFSANPTAQGVSLRGLGPSGASRSLVLLDGVPLNDPFGGWVAWSKVPRESLDRIEMVRGGGATAWGNAALGGIVQLFTTEPLSGRLDDKRGSSESNPIGYKRPGVTGRLAMSGGAFATHSAEGAMEIPIGRGALQLLARDFATDGFFLVAPEDRGPVDLPAASDHRWLAGRWQQDFGAGMRAVVTARTYREHRNNGTPYQRNSTAEDFASLALQGGEAPHFAWQAVAYAQEQSYASTFGSVNATRTTETPASDQYDVPASAQGAAWTGAWEHAGDARTSAGVDYRRVHGETREYFTFSAGSFTRERVAGGTQDIAGLFVLHQQPHGDNLRVTLGGRLDFWREQDGHRRETERATGNVLRDEAYPDRDGVEFSPSAGLVWQPAKEWRLRAAAQHSFRRATLNELYRPFRVGNVITEANAALDTERATSAELDVEHTRGEFTTSAVLFWNDLRDAVGNVTIAKGPGTFPIVGFVPAGGLGRQRLNLDRLRVQGLELSARWQPSPRLALTADYLYNDAIVRAATAAPALVDKRLAQVPRHTAAFGASWQPAKQLTFTPRVRALGRQFEDDENLLRLGAALVVDLGVSYRLNEKCELYLNAENLTNERVETGRSADGVVNIGTPRLVSGGVRCTW